ncbi:hypothetical protein E4U21_001714 [Claviceps maximensis]|nr:hypothetical protein E4U21_001714 [Claviceps maximensis]
MASSAASAARAEYLKEDELLRKTPPGDLVSLGNVFENPKSVGRFWRIVETRPYMRARAGFVDTLLWSFNKVGTPVDVVQTALDHLTDMLRLSRSDSMGLRSMIPPLLIRLGRDQDAYDNMKWYATTGQREDYDWADMRLPFLNTRGADVFEDVDSLWASSKVSMLANLSHPVSVMLIKTRLLLDLQSLQAASPALDGTTMLPEVNQFVGPILTARPDLLNLTPAELTALVAKLKNQMAVLFKAVHKYNETFWHALLHRPKNTLADNQGWYSPRSPEEAALHASFTFYAWAETRGALELLKGMYNEHIVTA